MHQSDRWAVPLEWLVGGLAKHLRADQAQEGGDAWLARNALFCSKASAFVSTFLWACWIGQDSPW